MVSIAQKLSWLLIVAWFVSMQPALAQQTRKFPPNSQLGSLTAVAFPHFTINGQQMTMGAGGQIRGIDNMIILPSTANYIGLIRYQLDTMGNLHRVWILTPDEVKEAESEGQQIPKPKKRFFFF
ncbi:hypothetical protein C8R26_10298 [Nitrosomonas oligotropha]|uniref:Uncharacterized protein n=1 Tax=Nitrosomonas oligotropha TaxID=42354 RepID=A0A2T5I3Y0_9PROT|nr:hypothetical protein [Nitrosomonas oligotropha]PTQ78530.1 hypothetical protein C8R26_10298 [Nitrosomonas oligotropha]